MMISMPSIDATYTSPVSSIELVHVKKIKSLSLIEAISYKQKLDLVRTQIESEHLSITQQPNKELEIERLIQLQEPYIIERNKILDNPLKYYLPYYRRKLCNIDSKLDELELKIYEIQRENSISKNVIASAEEKLQKYSSLLKD